MTRSILLLSVAAFLAASMTRLADALLPEIAREFDVGIDSAALAITAFTFAYGSFQLVYGWVGARLGPYPTAAIATALAATGAIVSAMADSLTMLAIGRFWSGMTVAAVIPMSMAYIGETVPYEKRQAVIASFLFGQVLGVIMGQAFAGVFAQFVSWRELFWLLALGFALVAAGLWREITSGHVTAHQPHATQRTPIRAYADVLALPWARIVLAAVVFEGFVCFGTFPFLSSHLDETFGLSPLSIGLVMSCFGLGGLAYILAVRPLHGLLGERGLVMTGGAIMFAGFALVAASGDWRWLIAASAAMGLGYYMLHNTLQTNATQMAPFNRSAAIALFAFGLFVSQALGVAATGPLILSIGYTPVFALAAFLALALGMALQHAIKNKPAMTG